MPMKKVKRKHWWVRMYLAMLMRVCFVLMFVLMLSFVGMLISCELNANYGWWEGAGCLYIKS